MVRKVSTKFLESRAELCVSYAEKAGGGTPWTRIEETAIRNRAFNEGYSFTVFIPLDRSVPKWLPKTQLWVGLERFGLTGAAAVLEARIQQEGGQASEESLADRAARFQRSEMFNAQKKSFHASGEGVSSARQSFHEMMTLIASNEEILSAAQIEFKRYKHPQSEASVFLIGRVFVRPSWRNPYVNTLNDSKLRIELFDGMPGGTPGYHVFEEPRRLRTMDANYELTRPDHPAWVFEHSERRQFTTQELARFILKIAMDESEKLFRAH